MCLCAFYELLFCFEDGNLSKLPRERAWGISPSSATHLALGRRRRRPGAVPGLGSSW